MRDLLVRENSFATSELLLANPGSRRVILGETQQPATVGELDILVLAAGRRSCIGVHLGTGALVRTHQPRATGDQLLPFDTARALVSKSQFERLDQPEALEIATPLTWSGSMYGWRVDRILRSVMHPLNQPLLGSVSSTLPFWTIKGDRPSVSLVSIASSSLSITVDGRGVRCRFPWNNGFIDLPLEDRSVLSRLDWLPSSPLQGSTLTRAIGFRPARAIVALSRPVNGYCHKVIAGLLPRP
jgi:hypothetical protein